MSTTVCTNPGCLSISALITINISFSFVLNVLSSLAKLWHQCGLCQSQMAYYTNIFACCAPCSGKLLYLRGSSALVPLERHYSSETLTAFCDWCQNELLVNLFMWTLSAWSGDRVSAHIHVISLQSQPASEGFPRWMGCWGCSILSSAPPHLLHSCSQTQGL